MEHSKSSKTSFDKAVEFFLQDVEPSQAILMAACEEQGLRHKVRMEIIDNPPEFEGMFTSSGMPATTAVRLHDKKGMMVTGVVNIARSSDLTAGQIRFSFAWFYRDFLLTRGKDFILRN